jgi:lipid-A-disaccharide synthase
MLIAGEASGDLLAAELISALRGQLFNLNREEHPQFFGAGGQKMIDAEAELAFDLTKHAVIGITGVLLNYFKFRRMFDHLLELAIERKPDAIIGVDYGGFNLRFGHAVREYVRNHPREHWQPKIIQFVSPQVWASRAGRAKLLAKDYDLLLSIFPFERDWYAKRAPKLRVEFVGHPMVERFENFGLQLRHRKSGTAPAVNRDAQILLLPGSRTAELKSHLPVMLGALKLIQAKLPGAKAKMVLPNESLKKLATGFIGSQLGVEIQVANLPEALALTDAAIASTGTVTMECAFFGVPTVTLYKTSWLTYEIGRRIVTVKSLTMPNLLADNDVYPEFIQAAATPENISRAALELLQDEARRQKIKSQLGTIIATLGGPGASQRAAAAILSLFQ